MQVKGATTAQIQKSPKQAKKSSAKKKDSGTIFSDIKQTIKSVLDSGNVWKENFNPTTALL